MDFVNLEIDGIASEGSTHVNIIDTYTTAANLWVW
jgi:hypothetical protein